MDNTRGTLLEVVVKSSRVLVVAVACWCLTAALAVADHHLPAQAALPKAFVDGTGPGWRTLGEVDFVNVNCDEDTWTWKDGALHCTGQPVGVMRSKKPLTNFELVVEWNHRRAAGNSGVFVWTTKESLDRIKPGQLPQGMEVQMLDHGYATNHEKRTGSKAEWFTTNGDVFGANGSRFKPFAPVSPDGSRSFPSKNLTHGTGQWNHYYVRCVNGEVRLWVNGEEVSGGSDCEPRTGYLAMESEGSPIDFRHLRIRELP